MGSEVTPDKQEEYLEGSCCNPGITNRYFRLECSSENRNKCVWTIILWERLRITQVWGLSKEVDLNAFC